MHKGITFWCIPICPFRPEAAFPMDPMARHPQYFTWQRMCQSTTITTSAVTKKLQCDIVWHMQSTHWFHLPHSQLQQRSYISYSIHQDIMPVGHCPQSSWPSPVNDILLNAASMSAFIIVVVVVIIIIITRKISTGMQRDWSTRSNVSPARGRKELPMHRLPWRSCTPACSKKHERRWRVECCCDLPQEV